MPVGAFIMPYVALRDEVISHVKAESGLVKFGITWNEDWLAKVNVMTGDEREDEIARTVKEMVQMVNGDFKSIPLFSIPLPTATKQISQSVQDIINKTTLVPEVVSFCPKVLKGSNLKDVVEHNKLMAD
jgi:hypothetical protein